MKLHGKKLAVPSLFPESHVCALSIHCRTVKLTGPKSSWENPSASEDEDNSHSGSGSDGGGGSDADGSGPRRAEKKKKKSKEKPRKKTKQPAILYSDAQLSGLLKDVVAKGMYFCLPARRSIRLN